MTELNQADWKDLHDLHFEATACPVCEDARILRCIEKNIRGYEMRFTRCAGCESLYANPRATRESLNRIYDSWNFFEGGSEQINYYSYTKGERYRRKTADLRLAPLVKHARGRDLLEAASAAGFFLHQAKIRGFHVTGVEISKPMATWSAKRWDVPVIPESIEETTLEPNSLDIIASWGLFTIIRNPRALLVKYNRALKTGGIIGLNTYYSESLWGRFWNRYWYILVLNTSQIFSKNALLRLFSKTGFEVVEMKRERQYANLQYILFQLGNHLPDRFQKGFQEKALGLDDWIFPVPLPDVFYYVCRKVREV